MLSKLLQLISSSDYTYYIVIDAAIDSEILDKAKELLKEDNHVCLCTEQDIESGAGEPYLFKLDNESFLKFIFEKYKISDFGIIAEFKAETDFDVVVNHFRSLIKVRNHEGQLFYFRFYDPEVLRVFLPLCDKEQSEEFFDQVQAYYLSNETGSELLCFRKENHGLPSSISRG